MLGNRPQTVLESYQPKRNTGVKPVSVFFPAACRGGVRSKENVGLAHLNRLPSIKKCVCCSSLREVHCQAVHLRLLFVISRSKSTNYKSQDGIGVAKTWELNAPTVNKNGHLPSTAAAVWMFSSKIGIIGYKEVVSVAPPPRV